MALQLIFLLCAGHSTGLKTTQFKTLQSFISWYFCKSLMVKNKLFSGQWRASGAIVVNSPSFDINALICDTYLLLPSIMREISRLCLVYWRNKKYFVLQKKLASKKRIFSLHQDTRHVCDNSSYLTYLCISLIQIFLYFLFIKFLEDEKLWKLSPKKIMRRYLCVVNEIMTAFLFYWYFSHILFFCNKGFLTQNIPISVV